jgi:hypothetical protein
MTATTDARGYPRFKLEIEIHVCSRAGVVLTGRTVDISESGIAAMLRMEVPLGELVKVDFTLPLGRVIIYAIGRQRSAFRYGFQFAESNSALELVRQTCRDFAIDHSLNRIA